MKTILFACIALGLASAAQAQQTSTENPSQVETTRPAAAGKNWLLGRWVLDQSYTEANQSAKDNPGVSGESAEQISEKLVDKMKGATITVTDSEITMSRDGAAGKSQRYALIENPDPNVIQLMQESGEVLTFHREGERIRTKTSGDLKESFFFKRAQ